MGEVAFDVVRFGVCLVWKICQMRSSRLPTSFFFLVLLCFDASHRLLLLILWKKKKKI